MGPIAELFKKKTTSVLKWWKLRFFMKSNKICSKLPKGANFAAANLPLRPQITTMTGQRE